MELSYENRKSTAVWPIYDIKYAEKGQPELATLKSFLPGIACIPLYESAAINYEEIIDCFPEAVSVNKEMVREDLINSNRINNLKTYVYTVYSGLKNLDRKKL